MAKAQSPLRLQQALVQAAKLDAARFHRSIAGQIEYWADLGRKISAELDPNDLLDIQAGLARLRVEQVEASPVDAETVFAALEADGASGAMASAIAEGNPVRYQASARWPGMLERLDEDGRVSVGQFRDGEFQARDPAEGHATGNLAAE